ncbi:hypothetical protein M436DRAFT_84918 [Aureobasidium namibiae CBS 147.97]|uniref:Uncharacterized protein n=1 Tax=Aureobasidium namibiae CBS 147.97 TaxID=1043004 RepID=A0A074WAB3_9PEZI
MPAMDIKKHILLNLQLDSIELEDFSITTATTKRGTQEIHTVYVVASNPRMTIARASGNTLDEAMQALLKVTSN